MRLAGFVHFDVSSTIPIFTILLMILNSVRSLEITEIELPQPQMIRGWLKILPAVDSARSNAAAGIRQAPPPHLPRQAGLVSSRFRNGLHRLRRPLLDSRWRSGAVKDPGQAKKQEIGGEIAFTARTVPYHVHRRSSVHRLHE
jgi:hypothetical protein